MRSQISTALSSRTVELSSSGRCAVDRQVEVREIARVAVVDALRAARAGERVAVVVEDGEGVAVLQRPRPPLLQRGGGGNEELRRLRRGHGRAGAACGFALVVCMSGSRRQAASGSRLRAALRSGAASAAEQAAIDLRGSRAPSARR